MDSGVDYRYLAEVLNEIRYQPPWRVQADREKDYQDGNQLSSDVLRELENNGIPPSIENVLGQVMSDITGMEEKQRTDFRVGPDGDHDPEAEQVADAIGFKLKQAEKRSGADKACTRAYDSLSSVGIAWVHVSRESDPFKYPYRCEFIHRNELYWDWSDKSANLEKARWLLRRKWVDKSISIQMFPKHKEIIEASGSGWNTDIVTNISIDSPGATDLYQSSEIERGWTIEEQEWWQPGTNKCCLFELLTRKWEQVTILRRSQGSVVEFDMKNPAHIMAVSVGFPLEKANIARVYKTIFLGPHKIQEEQSEFTRFNYVPIFGQREDRTGIPYGILRPLIYLQDEINARISKMKWLLGSRWTVRTEGASVLPDEFFRQISSRSDADFVLDQGHMALPGSTFEIHNNEQLNEQQYKRLIDLRESVKRISHVSAAMSGQERPDNLGAMSQAIEQSVQGLASINGNYFYGREQIYELLISMIIKDIGKDQQSVVIKGNMIKPDREITLNSPTQDATTGHQYLTNDVQRTALKVTMEEVPQTASYRQQELSAMAELGKSLPEEYRVVMAPYLINLSNAHNKEDIIKEIMAIRENKMLSEEQVQKRIEEAIAQAKTEWMVDQKNRDSDIREKEMLARVAKLEAEAASVRTETIYSGTQAGAQIASMPGVAQVADQVLRSAGFNDQDSTPIVASPDVVLPAPQVQENTSPVFPPRVQEPNIQSVEQAPMQPDHANAGMQQGIEKQGVQL
jgi:hypothetical protein